jgi:hypothetical protein
MICILLYESAASAKYFSVNMPTVQMPLTLKSVWKDLRHRRRASLIGFHFVVVLKCRKACMRSDHLCGLVVRVPGYRSRGPEFDSRHYQIFVEVMGLERGPLSLVSVTEELLE